MPNGNEAFNRKQHEQARPRALLAIKLRKQKKTWKDIGLLLGVSPQRAQRLAKAHS